MRMPLICRIICARGDRLVLNDTRVIPARLTGTRRRTGTNGDTRARVEATLLEACADGTWEALLKPLKKVHEGEVIEFSNDLSAAVVGRGRNDRPSRLQSQGARLRCRAGRGGRHAAAALHREQAPCRRA